MHAEKPGSAIRTGLKTNCKLFLQPPDSFKRTQCHASGLAGDLGIVVHQHPPVSTGMDRLPGLEGLAQVGNDQQPLSLPFSLIAPQMRAFR